MKKYLIIIAALLTSIVAFCQTPAHSFECHLRPNVEGFTQSQIETYISKANFEGYRLRDTRTTLTFSNGFEIVLLSASELLRAGLITDASSYLTAFPPQYKLPIFYLNQKGQIAAEHDIRRAKFSTQTEK